MYWIQELLEQPDEESYLVRYMAEWKYRSLLDKGLCFTQVFEQEDKNDGRALSRSGLSRMMNNDESGEAFFDGEKIETTNYRQNCYISCWVMEDEPNIKRFEEYCFKSNDQNISYAIKVKYIDLINFVKSKCKIVNQNYYFGMLRRYFVNWGVIKYEDLSGDEIRDYIAKRYKFEEIHTFYKNKKKFEHEQEFRLKLTINGGVYRQINRNFRREGTAEHVEFMSRFDGNCEYTLYRYDKNEGVVNLIDR